MTPGFPLALGLCLFCMNTTTSGFSSSATLFLREFGWKPQKFLSFPRITGLFESPSGRGDEARDLDSLKDWALANGVQLMWGAELVKLDSAQEWGVSATTLFPDNFQGLREVSIMSIPSNLILSSTSIENPSILPALAAHGMEHYVPEFCLFWILLREYAKGERSPFHVWIQSLPRHFTTAVYFDDVERAYARKLGAGRYLDHQTAQFEAFHRCLETVFPDHRSSRERQKWAYAVVLTRSWRTNFGTSQGLAVANLVPMGDLFNHHARATVHAKQDAVEDAVTIKLKKTTPGGCVEGLFLNYGYAELPERFMMVFGFCDTSSPVVCASSILQLFESDLDAKAKGFNDSTKMIFSTTDGSVGDTLWNAVLCKILHWQLASNPGNPILESDLKTLETLCTTMDDPMSDRNLIEVHCRYRRVVVDFLRHEVEDLLSDQFGPVPDFDVVDYSNHPRLAVLKGYHEYIRSIYQKVQMFLMEKC